MKGTAHTPNAEVQAPDQALPACAQSGRCSAAAPQHSSAPRRVSRATTPGSGAGGTIWPVGETAKL